LLGSWNYSATIAIFAALGMILTAGYILSMIQRVYLGPRYTGPNEQGLDFSLTRREASIAGVLLVLSIVLGVYPRLALYVTEPTLARLVENLDAGAAAAIESPQPDRTALNVGP